MARKFKLLAGRHAMADTSKPKGPNGRHPTKTVLPGQTVEDDRDLVALFGAGHFMEVGEKREKSIAQPAPAANPASFPNGQVSSGLQQCTSTEDGTTVSGPIIKDEGETAGGERDEKPTEDDELEEMTIAQLKEKAEAEDVDLSGASHKADIIKRFKK